VHPYSLTLHAVSSRYRTLRLLVFSQAPEPRFMQDPGYELQRICLLGLQGIELRQMRQASLGGIMAVGVLGTKHKEEIRHVGREQGSRPPLF
jgi:hypothetical protein